MKKNYKKWHPLKQRINNASNLQPFFHEREIWFCHFGENVGFEQDGVGNDFLRPVVIVRKFNNDIFWGVPLTKRKKETEFYFTFYFTERGQNTAILSQIRLIDVRRLSYLVGTINESDFVKLIEKLKALLP